ncbi:hypothetical protein PVK06_035335 [Gossypium arboreum]|uniref:Aminotransferase-like plant mobile domain-containing protein n=1 Tax=Gossypium arboreum TaxID=29729 RepID=A0ABR0NGJ4_GOSAR|nr:hypothetical protein PVK06_035335 [Gossypium arboreum]
MPDANGSTVHLMYLPLLSNLYNTRSYSWVSTVLAMLYRKLCRTIDPSAIDIGGCLILLQSWALYRMSFLASISHQSYIFPLINRWSTNLGIRRLYTVSIYRLMIENHAGERIVEWYHGDRVHRQFGCIQYILVLPVQLGEIHWMNRRGKYENDRGEVHEEYITMWNYWMRRVL